MEDSSLERIFSTILGNYLLAFDQSMQELTQPMTRATIAIYNHIQDELRPTPTRSHYTYNLRDLSAVFQGVLSASRSFIESRDDLVRLWVHETTRVFHDRLINDEDREVFNNELKAALPRNFGLTWDR